MSADITWRPSPNFSERRNEAAISLVVLHYTAMATAEAACERLCDSDAEVSAHYVISETGQVTQLVDEAHRAWHAGVGAWGDCDDVNSASIGIELANYASNGLLPPFPEPQMTALEDLLRAIFERHDLKPNSVIGHSDMAPERKVDPGPKFDWQRLAKRGLSIWPGELSKIAMSERDFFGHLHQFGYRGIDEHVLAAFRLRFRPAKSGPIDDTDKSIALAINQC